VAAALVLKRKLPGLPFSILYAPKGPCLDYRDEGLREDMLAALIDLARREGAIFLKIDPDVPVSRGHDELVEDPVGQGLTAALQAGGWRFSPDQIQFRNTVLLDLTSGEEALLAAMKQKTRYNIRLAGRRDVVVRAGEAADLLPLAAMYAETAERDAFAIRPEAYYLDAWRTFLDAGMGLLLLAEVGRELIAGVFIVRHAGRAIYMYGASRDAERHRMPNYLLQWEAIRWAIDQGCADYDFWGAPDVFDESDRLWGVWRFKSGFNGEVVRHVGAWDYPVRPFWTWIYRNVTPRYLAWLRRRRDGQFEPS
jgi:lipid II:glycine glycyltransferase (peptidoglycan interpeptide bridge formation enzyme)